MYPFSLFLRNARTRIILVIRTAPLPRGDLFAGFSLRARGLVDSTAKAKFVVSPLSEKILIYVTEMSVARERRKSSRSFLLLRYRVVDHPGEVSGER